MSFDFGQAVIDNEIALMIKRVGEGLGFSEDSVSLEEIEAPRPSTRGPRRRRRRDDAPTAHPTAQPSATPRGGVVFQSDGAR